MASISRFTWLLLALILVGCRSPTPAAGTHPLDTGWEYRLVEPRAGGSATRGAPLWEPIEHLAGSELDGAREFRVRAPLPARLPAGPRLIFRALPETLALYVDRELVYSFHRDARLTRPAVHVVALPEDCSGRWLELRVPRALARNLVVTDVVVVSETEAPPLLGGYLVAPLRRSAVRVSVGVLLAALGVLLVLLGLLQRRRGAALLLTGAACSLIYAVRLLAESPLATLLGAPETQLLHIRSFATYLIAIASWALIWQLIGSGWKRLILWQLRVVSLFAVIGIAGDLIQGQPFTLTGAPNNLLVLLGLAVLAVCLYQRRGRFTRRERTLVLGLAVLALFILNENLVGLGVVPWSVRGEWVGVLFFILCLGYMVFDRVLAQERELTMVDGELQTAARIQSSLLPRTTPGIAGLEIAARYRPMSAVGGDLYDYLQPDAGQLGVLVADVSGHGVPAALIASMVKVALSAQAEHAADPERVLTGINQVLTGKLERDFVTAAYVFVDLEQGSLVAARAGHPRPLIFRSTTSTLEALEADGLLLGRVSGARYPSIRLPLHRGDRVILYTDGIVEAMNAGAEMYGLARLEHFIRAEAGLPPAPFSDKLMQSVESWCPDVDDDLTLVVMDVKGRQEETGDREG